jgi:hypothetical protein
MSTELKTTLAEHAAGNYRVMMNTADELLGAAAERNADHLDEKLFFVVFPATRSALNSLTSTRPPAEVRARREDAEVAHPIKSGWRNRSAEANEQVMRL